MKPTAAQLRQLHKNNMEWPVALAPVPRASWPALPHMEGVPRTGLFRSRQFLVQRFDEPGGIIRLSVNRTEWDERQQRFREDVSWDDLQRLKAEVGFPDHYAVEVFPAEGDVVNVANMRHLWILPEAPAFAWRRQRRSEAA